MNPIKALLLQPFLEFESIHEEQVTTPNQFHNPETKMNYIYFVDRDLGRCRNYCTLKCVVEAFFGPWN